MLTERENRYCVEISHRVARMRSFLSTNNLKEPPDPTGLFEFLLSLRQIQGNLSNDVSFAATLLTKQYLFAKFGVTFDAAEKPQGAPGIDIDLKATDGLLVLKP